MLGIGAAITGVAVPAGLCLQRHSVWCGVPEQNDVELLNRSCSLLSAALVCSHMAVQRWQIYRDSVKLIPSVC
jgi:hypothetical protein